jgi:predicted phosphodiesterase
MKLALITDIHEDYISLKEAIRKIDKLAPDTVVCLGDISGFSAPYYSYRSTRNAHECLNIIRATCSQIILGNHDIHAAQIIPKNCSFFDYPENWYQLNYHERHELGSKILWLHEEDDLNPLYKESDLLFLRTLPEYATMELPAENMLFTHYVYPNLSGLKTEFYTYADEYGQHMEFMHSLNCRISFCGHAHTQGFFIASPKGYKEYRFTRVFLPASPVCVGIPPITSGSGRNGFLIYDTAENSVRAYRI